MPDSIPTPTSCTSSFISPNDPLLELVTKHLLRLGDSLKDCMVIVPTAHSGRQLRQALPRSAGRAILAPSVVTPDILFRPQSDSKAATKIEWWHAWSEVLRLSKAEQVDALFPQLDGIDRDFNWGIKAATRFTKLKEEITSVYQSFSDVAELSDEPDRWSQLAELDLEVISLLQQRNLLCPAEAKRFAAENWQVAPGVEKIIIAAVPDLPMLTQLSLSRCSVPVEILIQADEELSESFDSWGIPLSSHWVHSHIEIPEPAAKTILIKANGHDAIHSLIEDSASHASDEIALAVTDSAFGSLTSDQFEKAGWPVFNPEGKPISKTGLWAFLKQLRLALSNPQNFLPIPSLLKSPEARTLLSTLKSPASAAKEIDGLTQRHLPQNLGHAIRCSSEYLKEPLTELQALLEDAKSSKASRALEQIFDRIERSTDFPSELIDPFLEAIQSIKHIEHQRQNLSTHHALDLVMQACESLKIQAERSGTVIDQLGWLELPYSSEPHLKLLGLHETCVPERPHDDGFLPESLRQKIRLYSREQLEARDAYLLHNMLASRQTSGSVKIYLCQTTPSGEERQASRLLMRCPNDELPARVQHCFDEEISNSENLPAYSSGNWKLEIDKPIAWPEDKLLTVSPSRLRNFLHCPFRFYLQLIEGFDRKSFDSHELDPAQFGNVVHDVLEQYGLEPSLKDLSDSSDIQLAFITLLDELFDKKYGEQTTLPLSIQKESALQRLISFADQQAELRKEGWRILHVELAIGTAEDEIKWDIFDTPVRMRIDRIDVHEDTGRLRVIDYKTSKKVKTPVEEHFENIRQSDAEHHLYGTPLEPASSRSRSQRRWKNLQLPLYAEFVKDHFKLTELPEIGYVAFPAAAASTGLQLWSDYDDSLHQSALEWTENCLTAIRTGDFPIRQLPSQDQSWDSFAALTPDGLDQAFSL